MTLDKTLQRIIQRALDSGHECSHTFHRLGGLDDCPVCLPKQKIIQELCEEVQRLRLQLTMWEGRPSLSKYPVTKEQIRKALSTSALEKLGGEE